MMPGEIGSGDDVVGGRVRRATGAIVLVSLLALGVCVSSASAEPLSMTFTEARANVGADQLIDEALFEAPDTAPFKAQIDPGTGSITGGLLEVPVFETFIEDDPVDANVAVEFEIGVISGSFTQATGALTLSGEAGGTLTANGKECIVAVTDPPVLTLSTVGNSGGPSPRSGVPFTAGLAGTGAIAGQWNDMTATPAIPDEGVVVCEVVEEAIEGPGGVWLEQKDFLPPLAPQLTGTDPASPNSSGTPRILGAAEAGSTVRVYASSACAGTAIATGNAAQLGSPGIAVEVAKGVTAFSATATDAAGNTSACSAPISYLRLDGNPECTVPKLVGKKLARAKAALRAANCKLGTVRKPNRRGKRRRVLVVKSSNPAAGAQSADGEVDLRLGPKPRKARR
jgi:Bacterial Ig domain